MKEENKKYTRNATIKVNLATIDRNKSVGKVSI